MFPPRTLVPLNCAIKSIFGLAIASLAVWEQGFEFLDQELRQVVRDAELGKRFVDKLVKIYRTGGEETWILIHLEIQSQYEAGFAERIYVYNYRIYDRASFTTNPPNPIEIMPRRNIHLNQKMKRSLNL